jgi:hypothetical protein
MTSEDVMRGNSGLTVVVTAGKFKINASVLLFFVDFHRLFKPMKTLGGSFQSSCTGHQRFYTPESNGNSPLSSNSTSKRNDGVFTCCVFLVVLPTIKEIQALLL